jgi:flagellin-specific chaperone FliS
MERKLVIKVVMSLLVEHDPPEQHVQRLLEACLRCFRDVTSVISKHHITQNRQHNIEHGLHLHHARRILYSMVLQVSLETGTSTIFSREINHARRRFRSATSIYST